MDIVVFHINPASGDSSSVTNRDTELFDLFAVRWQAGAILDTLDLSASNAVSPEECIPKFLSFVEGRSLASFYGEDQLALLRAVCEDAGYDVPTSSAPVDISVLCDSLFPTNSDNSLTAYSDLIGGGGAFSTAEFNVNFVANQSANLLSACWNRALSLPLVTLQNLARLGGMMTPGIGLWFQYAADTRHLQHGVALPPECDQVLQIAFTRPDDVRRKTDDGAVRLESPETMAPNGANLVDQSSSLLKSDSPLSSLMEGFQVRQGQLEMVQAVADALEGDMHLLAEAGTGTGKSLAYLIPAALYARKNDVRVVVSTHTISLQDQIAQRDFPLLRKVVGEPLRLTVFKGRTHYVCMRKLMQEIRSVSLASTPADIRAYMKLLVWLTETEEGNREELQMAGKLQDVWPRIQSETETCINKRCPFFKPCYYFRARARAYEADLIVTNHSLIFSDLKAEHRVLPKYDNLILDEAHHIEEQATKHLGDEVHKFQCLALIGRLSRDNGKHGVVPELMSKLAGSDTRSVSALPALEQMIDTLRELRAGVDTAFDVLGALVSNSESDVRVTRDVEGTSTWKRYLDVTDSLHTLLSELEGQSEKVQNAAEAETDEELAGRLFDATGFLLELYSHVQLLCSAVILPDEWVVWIEVGGADRRDISLHRAPIDVAQILRNTLFETKQSVVLTSATLTSAESFDYQKIRLGLVDAERDGRLGTISVPSPFRFDQQSLLCVPTDVPELAKMSASEAAVWLSDSLYQYAKISGGRLLALFTSHQMLRATAAALREPLATLNMNLFAQGVDGSRNYVLDAFKSRPNSVLLGAQSFWEGIDLPGDQLTTLVIVRLPFAPPSHPVTQARHERLSQDGYSPFTHDSLPEAIVRFRQGFGRLIRTINDRGVVVVMDKRIVTARYGAQFIKSVPGVRKCIGPERQVLDQMRTFLHPGGKDC